MSKQNKPFKEEKYRMLEERAEIVVEKYEKFLQHNCPIKYGGAIGGKTTYSFTSTSLGTICKVECACGQKEDITNYDDW